MVYLGLWSLPIESDPPLAAWSAGMISEGYWWCFPVEVPAGWDWKQLRLWPLNTDHCVWQQIWSQPVLLVVLDVSLALFGVWFYPSVSWSPMFLHLTPHSPTFFFLAFFLSCSRFGLLCGAASNQGGLGSTIGSRVPGPGISAWSSCSPPVSILKHAVRLIG